MLTLKGASFDINLRRGVVTILLGRSKTGKRLGEDESVVVQDVNLCCLLAAFLQGRRPGDLLWPHSASRFRVLFQEYLEYLGIGKLGFKPVADWPGVFVHSDGSIVVVDVDDFTDIIGRHFRQPKEGLGFDGSPVAHMWRSMIWPNNFL